MNQSQWSIHSKTGPLYLVASREGLRYVGWKPQEAPMAASLDRPERELAILAAAATQLEEYFTGRRKDFDLPLDIQGTDFQKRVWTQLCRIPYGETRSYRDLARDIQHEAALRAVGAANGQNPLSIVVPCHRVIAADGGLRGYSGGLTIKAQLLDLERKIGQVAIPGLFE